jgi:hypothetical protein
MNIKTPITSPARFKLAQAKTKNINNSTIINIRSKNDSLGQRPTTVNSENGRRENANPDLGETATIGVDVIKPKIENGNITGSTNYQLETNMVTDGFIPASNTGKGSQATGNLKSNGAFNLGIREEKYNGSMTTTTGGGMQIRSADLVENVQDAWHSTSGVSIRDWNSGEIGPQGISGFGQAGVSKEVPLNSGNTEIYVNGAAGVTATTDGLVNTGAELSVGVKQGGRAPANIPGPVGLPDMKLNQADTPNFSIRGGLRVDSDVTGSNPMQQAADNGRINTTRSEAFIEGQVKLGNGNRAPSLSGSYSVGTPTIKHCK